MTGWELKSFERRLRRYYLRIFRGYLAGPLTFAGVENRSFLIFLRHRNLPATEKRVV